MPRFAFVVVMLWTAVVLLAPGRASARQVSFGSGAQAVQSLSVGYYLIDFEFNGDERPLFVFDFDQPAYGLVYSRPHFLFTFALGDQSADGEGHEALRLLDISFTTWGELGLSRSFPTTVASRPRAAPARWRPSM